VPALPAVAATADEANAGSRSPIFPALSIFGDSGGMRNGRQSDTAVTALPDPKAALKRASTEITLDTVQSPVVRDARDTWMRLRGERRMPSRADMTPRAMRGFLKYLSLLEVLDGGRDFRFRISGDVVNIQQGMTLQGLTTSDWDAKLPGFGTHMRRVYHRVFRRGEPVAYSGLYLRAADQHTFSHESFMAPLGDDGETVDHLIVVSAP
jgi:hypothetical protein